MKSTLLVLFIAFTQTLFAQTFVEAPQTPPFEGVALSSIAFADIDGDNDQDLFIAGRDSSDTPISKLYTNDGTGSFTEMTNSPIEGVEIGSIAFADVDGDNDQDLLITGYSSTSAISKLYINDGMGNFSELLGTPFEAIRSSFIAFADVDGDNDQDVLITGRSGSPSAARTTKFYTNDGLGNYTEVLGAPFDPVSSGSIRFADFDNDNDLDVLLSGFTVRGGGAGGSGRIAKIYTNDSLGTFTEMQGTPFEAVSFSSSALADIDGNNSLDILIIGNNSAGPLTKLYANDGTGNFSEVMDTPFDSIYVGSIAFADVDGDNDQDVLLTGSTSSNIGIAKLYSNDGVGNFTEIMDTPFEGVSSSSVAFADVDGDNDQDVFITGYDSSRTPISKLYLNEWWATSIDELNYSLGFDVFPNPSSLSTLFLSYDSEEMSELTIKVYSLKGVLLKQQQEFAQTGEHLFSIDISSLAKGIYIIELDNGKRRGLSKFAVH